MRETPATPGKQTGAQEASGGLSARRDRKDLPTPATARADLHLHSGFSDGTLSPPDLVRQASSAGLHTISLTDHDTVSGLTEAASACKAAGLGFIPGVELSVGYGKGEIHLLGYGIDHRGRKLRDTLDLLAAEREERMVKMVARLNSLGIPADFDEIKSMASGPILSRLHLANYLLGKQFVQSRDEAFRRLIGNGRPAHVRRHRLTLKDAIDLIVGSGGVVVVAHPGLTRRDDLMDYFVRLGISGLEVYYPRHSPGDVSRYQKICRRHDLVATGGSDFHGSGKPENHLGMAVTPPKELDKLLKLI